MTLLFHLVVTYTYRKESSTDWNEYKSIVSYNHLLAAITGQMVQQPTKVSYTHKLQAV